MNQPDWKKLFGHVGYFLLTTFLVAGAAFFNKFPLVRDVSGAYIENGFSLVDVSPGYFAYALFIRVVTWQASLWPIVLVQAALLNFLLLRLTKTMVPSLPLRFLHFPVVLLLTLFTSMSWMVSTIHPDIFLPIAILAGFVFVLDHGLPIWAKTGLGILIVWGMCMQFHYGIMGFLFIAGLFLLLAFRFKAIQQPNRRLMVGLMVLLALPVLQIPAYQMLRGGAFSLPIDMFRNVSLWNTVDVFPQLAHSKFTHYPLMWVDDDEFGQYAEAFTAKTIQKRVPHAFGEYMNCRQNRDNLQLWYLPWLNGPLQIFAMGMLIWGMWRWKPGRYWPIFVGMLAFTIFVSALIEVMFEGVNDFAGARMSWLLVLGMLLMVAPKTIGKLPFREY